MALEFQRCMTTWQRLTFPSYSFFTSFGFQLLLPLSCYFTSDHLLCFVAHFNSVQLYKTVTTGLIKSVSICDAIYTVMAVERILTAASCTFLSPRLETLQSEQMNVCVP